MDAAKLLELMTIELKLARALLTLADSDAAESTDPEGAIRVLDLAGTALETVRTFMSEANLPAAERAYIESELTSLEKEVQTRHCGQETARRKKRK
jgi:hypothetical protein